MLRRVLAGGVLGVLALVLLPLLTWAAAEEKEGMVITKDTPPHTYIGEIDDTVSPGHVQINSSTDGKILIDSRNVEKVVYFKTPAEEFAGRLSAMDRNDVTARVNLARFAIDHKMYPQAREVLIAALALEPGNRAASDMLKEVDAQTAPANPPPTQPATGAEPGPAGEPQGHTGVVRARRTLTPEEINYIRQNEWTENDRGLRVQLLPEARRAALELGLINQDELRNMTPADIGWVIVHHGPAGLRKGVRIGNDPGTLLTYRERVHKFVIASCATGACHNTEKGGNFYLFTDPPGSDATIDTDYLILQQYTKTIKGTEYSMIDRLHPENSLLTQFSLPPTMATVSHPKAPGYVPPAKPPFLRRQIENWIASLPAVAPSYDAIDLAKPPPTEARPATRPAAPSAVTQ